MDTEVLMRLKSNAYRDTESPAAHTITASFDGTIYLDGRQAILRIVDKYNVRIGCTEVSFDAVKAIHKALSTFGVV